MKQEVPIKMEDVLVETIRNINPQLYENLTGDQLIKVFHFTFDPIVAKQYILAAMQEWEKITNRERDLKILQLQQDLLKTLPMQQEIERLKGLIEKAFEAGEKYEQDRHKPSFTGFLDGYTGIYGFKKFAKENNL